MHVTRLSPIFSDVFPSSFFAFLSSFFLLFAIPSSFGEPPHPGGQASSDHKQFHLFSGLVAIIGAKLAPIAQYSPSESPGSPNPSRSHVTEMKPTCP